MIDSSSFMPRLSLLYKIENSTDENFFYDLFDELCSNNYIVSFEHNSYSPYVKIKDVFGAHTLLPCNLYVNIIYDEEAIKKINLNSRVSLFVKYY